MKTPFIQAALALSMHYAGLSLNTIRKQLEHDFLENHSRSSIFKWTNIYPRRVLEAVKNAQPGVGDSWIAIETELNLCGRQWWIWDVVDRDTLFLLTTLIPSRNHESQVKLLIDEAIERAGKSPREIIADRLAARVISLLTNYRQDTRFGGKWSFTVDHQSTNEIERLQKLFQQRSDLVSSLKSMERAIQFTNGWLAHYNYFSRQDVLKGRTPAELARIEYPQLRVEYLKSSRCKS